MRFVDLTIQINKDKIIWKLHKFTNSVFVTLRFGEQPERTRGREDRRTVFLWPKQQMLVAGCSERRVPHLAHSGGDHETFCLHSCTLRRHVTALSPASKFNEGQQSSHEFDGAVFLELICKKKKKRYYPKLFSLSHRWAVIGSEEWFIKVTHTVIASGTQYWEGTGKLSSHLS